MDGALDCFRMSDCSDPICNHHLMEKLRESTCVWFIFPSFLYGSQVLRIPGCLYVFIRNMQVVHLNCMDGLIDTSNL
jgi:hypothetical protein